MNARALFAALFTIVVWASLALLTDRIKHLPPLLSSGLALMVGGMVGAWQTSAWRAPLSFTALVPIVSGGEMELRTLLDGLAGDFERALAGVDDRGRLTRGGLAGGPGRCQPSIAHASA